jgi:hypothetical protein
LEKISQGDQERVIICQARSKIRAFACTGLQKIPQRGELLRERLTNLLDALGYFLPMDVGTGFDRKELTRCFQGGTTGLKEFLSGITRPQNTGHHQSLEIYLLKSEVVVVEEEFC